MRYPYFIGAALWISWVLSLVLGKGYLDASGHLIGTDFVAFYTAGKILWMGQSAELYNLELAHQVQQPLYNGGSDNFNPYLNPPFYAWIFVPFAMLPYPWSPFLWMAVNLVLLWFSTILLGVEKPWQIFFLSLTWQPAFAAISFGQNAFLSLAIISLAYKLWRKDKLWIAGLIAGLLLYKPQLLIGIGLLCLLDFRRYWRFLAGCLITMVGLSSLSFWLMPEATLLYLTYTQRIASNLMIVKGFPIWNAHSVQSFWLGLFPNQIGLAQILHAIFAIIGIWLFYRYWCLKRHDLPLMFAASICLTVWVTPYIMIYDWVLLLIPAIIFWRHLPEQRVYLKALNATLWIALFISSVLTFVQWTYLERAIQISIPVLAVVLLSFINLTKNSEPDDKILSAV
jgi:hypothetical protein